MEQGRLGLGELKNRVKARDVELDLLNSFITKDPASLIPSLVVSGYKAVGKTYTIQSYLEAMGINNTIVRCDECITQKLLLQRCLKKIKKDSGVDLTKYQQQFNYKGQEVSNIDLLCENFASFVVALEQFVEESNYKENHVLVLDRFDQCIDSTSNLFPAFLRLHEYSKINNISIVFIVSHDDPKEVVTFSIPHIFFDAYSEEQVVEILQSNQFCFFGDERFDDKVEHDFWIKYTKLIVDIFFSYTGSDMNFLIDICDKLWNSFINPVILGKYKPNEFIKIYQEDKGLFDNDNIINNSSIQEFSSAKEEEENNSIIVKDLPYHSKFILIASYLASFVEPKNDLHFFSKMNSLKVKTRKNSKKNLLSKSDIDNRLLSPNYFDLERLRAILSVIYRNEADPLSRSNLNFYHLYQDLSEREQARKDHEFSTFSLNTTIDLNSQIATLASLGLITRTYALDILSSKIRWKCNISWSTVEAISKDINFPLLNYLAE
ncbi:hypothetical protein HYPBUDRAFT_146299 [Hyphopichia burtonii NRRL Y-1933]|uniref:Uncharacterized protein n=1 Tax=Hyphopichia burtonii NRRL Y-1933 TaxID=984485 RepID=A0A1E4RRJ2_9ASCO|nr:hypothetical protein HYPBUDRAFT_146299 [Hyphopichia burtonii NRRL Y-1933]ODV69914.1 hypothetical protein HYPBUDRAFT_146299 [Hyphopichia burtonii NRRL Y-1933]